MKFQRLIHSVSATPVTMIAALTLAACGGGSGGSGGDSGGFSATDKAAAAAFGGVFIALDARELADQAGDGAGGNEATLATAASKALQQVRQVAKNTEACSGGGTLTESIGSVDSTFAGTLATERIVAVNCEESIPEANFSSSLDGVIEFADAEGGKVFYFKASGASDDPDNGDFYSSRLESPNFESETDMRGLMEICDGCSAPQSGGNIEQDIFLEARLLLSKQELNLQFGRNSGDPLRFVGTTSGNTWAASLDGLLSIDVVGSPCAFSADYETVETLQFTDVDTVNERITGGILNIVIDGGDSFEVEFQSDGSVVIDGQTYTEADLEALDETCGFDG